MKALGLSEQSITTLPKGAIEKQVLAWHLRRQTTVSNDWIAGRLHCGHPSNVPRYIKVVETSKDRAVVSLKKVLPKCGG